MRTALVITAAALVAGLGLLWLRDSAPDTTAAPSAETGEAEPPQLVIQGLQRITTDYQGLWQSTLTADEALYFDTEDRLALSQPFLDSLTEDGEPVDMRARRADLRDGHRWQMHDDVELRHAPASAEAVSITTTYLEYDTITDVAQTFAPVTLVQTDRMITHAIGMTLNISTREFELHEQVRSLFYPD